MSAAPMSPQPTRPTVAIVGAGLTGIYMAKACKDRGLPFTVYEAGPEVGGTWRDNVYPGISVDSPGGWYNLPFAPKFDWSRLHAPGSEIQAYLKKAATKAGIRPFIKFGSTITKSSWNEGKWHLELAGGDTATADVLILATGFIRVPVMPDIAGKESFAGPSFHSSRWDPSLRPAGKRIGVIGMGSSGIQLTTALARMDCRVTQFVRTPQWVHTVSNPQNSWLKRRWFAISPGAGQRATARRITEFVTTDPRSGKFGDWKRFPGPARDAAFEAFRNDLNLIRDPELREKMTPTDLPGCRRMPLAPGYYEAIQQPNVAVIRDKILRIEPDGVVTSDGSFHALDVLVYATGFDTHAYFKPMKVFGNGPDCLSEVWKSGPTAYRTLMVPDYPNLFVMHGPYAPVNNISAPLSTEDQSVFVMKAIDFIESRRVAISPTTEATDQHLTRVRSALEGTTWATGCNSWYTAADGYQLLWPFGREEHQAMYAAFDPDDLMVVPL